MAHHLPARGRPGAVLFMSVVRQLTSQDFVNAQLLPTKKVAHAIIQRFRTKHHRTAILVAEGRSNIEVARLTGYTPQRVSDLQSDPAFIELVSGYRKQIIDGNLDEIQRMQQRLVNVSELAVDEIEDRLEDDKTRAQIPISELRQIAQFAADRSIAPPKAAPPGSAPPVNVTFNIGNKDIRPKDGPVPVEIDNEDQE